MAKKKFSPQQERLRAERAMQTMADGRRWTKSPPLVEASSFSPTKMFRKSMYSIADAVSNFVVGAGIDQGDYLDTDETSREVPSLGADFDSVNAAAVVQPVGVGDTAIADTSVPANQSVAEAVENKPAVSADVSQPEPGEVSQADVEDIDQDVQYVSFSIPESEPTVPVSQQEELADSVSTVDAVQPEGPVDTVEATPQQVVSQDVLQSFDFPIQESTAIQETQQTPPPPVVSTEAAAQAVDQPQQTPNAEAVVPEPAASDDPGSVSLIASVPLDNSEESEPLDFSGVGPNEPPESVIGQTQASPEPAPEKPMMFQYTVGESYDPPPVSSAVSREVAEAEKAPAVDLYSQEDDEPVSGGQRRADIRAGKAEAGVAKKATTNWNPDGTRTAKLSSGAEYDFDKPAGGFAAVAPMVSGGATPDVKIGDTDAGHRETDAEQGDSLSGAIDSAAEMQGELMERMANAIADLAVRLNHAEMILRRVGY